MYNQNFINDFNRNMYDSVLKNKSYFCCLKDSYRRRYTTGGNAMFLAIKESLDHYMAKMISEDSTCVTDKEGIFRKYYVSYIMDIIRENIIMYNGQKVYLDFNTNIIFQYLTDEQLNILFPNNSIRRHIANNNKILTSIMNKINNNELLENEELNLISRYFAEKKDLNDLNYKRFVEYIFDNREVINSSPELISAVLSYLPKFYGEGVENCRSFLASSDNFEYEVINGNNVIKKDNNGNLMERKLGNGTAFSSRDFPYTYYNFDIFSNLKLNSYNSLDYSRTFQYKDLYWLIFVEFHELSHQLQKKDLLSNRFDGAAYEINQLLGKENKENHDADETEIDADEKGWKKFIYFASKYLKNEEIRKKASLNAKAANCRRAFSMKVDPKVPYVNRRENRKRYIDFDMEEVMLKIKNNPSLLNLYKLLPEIFNESGEIKIDLLFKKMVADTPAGREICNYVFNNAPVDIIIDNINNGNYSSKQVAIFLENFVQVPHYNALALRDLDKIDINTYYQTDAFSQMKEFVTKKQGDNETQLINIEEQIEISKNTYFIESCDQFVKFIKVLDISQKRYNVFTPEIINSYYKFFLDYYHEMLVDIKVPDYELIEEKMDVFEKSENDFLKRLAFDTRKYLEEKKTVTLNPNPQRK